MCNAPTPSYVQRAFFVAEKESPPLPKPLFHRPSDKASASRSVAHIRRPQSCAGSFQHTHATAIASAKMC